MNERFICVLVEYYQCDKCYLQAAEEIANHRGYDAASYDSLLDLVKDERLYYRSRIAVCRALAKVSIFARGFAGFFCWYLMLLCMF